MKEHALPYTEHANEYKYITHADLSFDSLLTWQEGLENVPFLVTAVMHMEVQILDSLSARTRQQPEDVDHLRCSTTKTLR